MRVLWMFYFLFDLAACVPVLNYGGNQAALPDYSNQAAPTNYAYQAAPLDYAYQAASTDYAYQVAPPDYNYGQDQYVSPDVPSAEDSSQVDWWSDPVNPESAPVTNQLPQKFFDHVFGLHPIYSVSGRSRYQSGRSMYAQSHYAPGMPQSRPWPLPFPGFHLLPEPNPAPQPQDFSQSASQPAAHTPLDWGFPAPGEKSKR